MDEQMAGKTVGRPSAAMIKKALKVYFIAGTQDMPADSPDRVAALLAVLEQALSAGVTCFQLREKGAGAEQCPEKIQHIAEACQRLCREYGVPFVINDDVALALSISADGIHVGQSDEPIEQVLAQCAGKLWVGLSTNTLAQAQEASKISGIDYCGVGPIFPTSSKADAQAVVGVELLREIREKGIDKPLVGIGGISEANAADVFAAGADGVAVISAITQSDQPAKSVASLLASAGSSSVG